MTHADDFQVEVNLLLVGIASDRFHRLSDALPLDEPVSYEGGSQAWLGMKLRREACQTDSASSLAVEGLILETLAEVSRRSNAVSVRTPPSWLSRAKELVHDQFSENLTHEYLAAAVSVHPVHLARVFRRFHGCTLGEYIRQLKIGHACRKIAKSEDSLAEIALSAGFSDQSHFSRVFKQLVGMSPAEFRTNLGEQ